MVEFWNDLSITAQATVIAIAVILVGVIVAIGVALAWPSASSDVVIALGLLGTFIAFMSYSLWDLFA